MRPLLTSSIVFTSANSTYETQSAQVKQPPANIVLLDRMLAPYGTETNSVRNLPQESVTTLANRIWRENSSNS
jgi:hypothetical protein